MAQTHSKFTVLAILVLGLGLPSTALAHPDNLGRDPDSGATDIGDGDTDKFGDADTGDAGNFSYPDSLITPDSMLEAYSMQGLSFGGIAGAEYGGTSYSSNFRLGLKLDAKYGVSFGGGLAGVGVHLTGRIDVGYGGNLEAALAAFYKWDDKKVSVGNIQNSFDYVVRPFATITSPVFDNSGNRPFAARFDSNVGQGRGSVSFDEFDNLAVAVKYPLRTGVLGYAAVEYDVGSNYLNSTVGIFTRFNDHDIRLSYSCFGGNSHLLEGEAAYNFTDRLRGSVYAGIDFNGSSSSTTLAGRLSYDLTDKVSLAGGVSGTVGSPNSVSAFLRASYGFP